MNTLNSYQTTIIKVTGCSTEDASEIEDYMRETIFQCPLEWQSANDFDRAAKEAYADIMYMRSPEGKLYTKLLRLSFN